MTTPRRSQDVRPTTLRGLLALIGVLAIALVGAGCGDDDDDGDDGASGGRDLFINTCGSCHTLEDAGTGGQVGPELTGGGYDAETVASIITNGQGAMPAGLLSGDDQTAVADYVAEASQ